jgi:hypothetical protein
LYVKVSFAGIAGVWAEAASSGRNATDIDHVARAMKRIGSRVGRAIVGNRDGEYACRAA